MTQVWKNNKVIPVTVVNAIPNEVFLIRNLKKDGYEAVQVGFGKYKKESRELAGENLKIGDKISVSLFKEGDKVKVSGYSKGRGFQGVVKRHGFAGGPKSHGQKDRLRAPGSIGATTPQKVIKGKKMAGRMGGERVTVKNLEIVEVRPEENLILIKGALPGMRGNLVEIRKVS